MSDSPQDLDLKFLPDWLKEGPSTNRYADFEGESESRFRRDRPDRPGGNRPPDRRGPRPGGGNRPQGQRPGGPGGGGPRPPGGGGGPRGDRRGGPQGDRRGGPRGDDRRGGGDRRDFGPRRDEPRPAPAPAPAELRVDFLPESHAGAGIAKQIKSSGRAYGVFHTAKLFLERPERHRVRISSAKPEVQLFQIGDGPISFDRAAIERNAFLHARDEYYQSETVQGEPIKGNFSNVARCRASGTLLGPTNHHGYKPALLKLYEERFSRRMSFADYQQYEIEIVSDEQTVNDWKEQARTTTTFTTTKEAEPVSFKSAFDAEQHFKKTYLPTLVKAGQTLECSGPSSRAGLDRHVSNAVRNAWEKERAFPQGLVNALRPYFSEVGLHFFKHRKRMLHVSSIKPLRAPVNQPFSETITAILKAVDAQAHIKRPALAIKILGEGHESEEAVPKKAQLASDLHYLVQMGHVIEFADGSFDLPLAPKPDQPQQGQGKSGQSGKGQAATADAAVAGAEAAESAEAEGEADVAAEAAASEEAAEPVTAEADPEASVETVAVEPVAETPVEAIVEEAAPVAEVPAVEAPVAEQAPEVAAEAPTPVEEPVAVAASAETPAEPTEVAPH